MLRCIAIFYSPGFNLPIFYGSFYIMGSSVVTKIKVIYLFLERYSAIRIMHDIREKSIEMGIILIWRKAKK